MRRLALPLALPLLSLALAACGDDSGPLMRPGENCMTCHGGTSPPGGGERGPRFTVAGTVFGAVNADVNSGLAGVTITITDAASKKVTLTSNAAGNFYTAEAVTFPISAEVSQGGKTLKMSQMVSEGGCASCHSVPPSGNAPGRVTLQ